jgi:branched-chain amino acid transport system substrate-binding protein
MRRKARRKFIFQKWIFTIIFFCIFGSGCQNDAPIKVGFIAGTSGRGADLGISGRDAVQMAIEQCNKNGGINGRRIEIVFKDDQQDPEIAKRSAQELIDDGVVAIIGPMTSDMGIAITPLLDKYQIPAVSPTVSTQHLAGRDDFFFRVTSTTLKHATNSAAYHVKATDIRRIAAVFDINNRSFSETWLLTFKEFFNAHGGELVAEIAFNSQHKKSFTDITHELLSHKADGILIIANSMDSALLCQQIRKIDTAIPISLADWGATERLLELGGKAVEGVIVIQTFDRGHPGERYQAFRKAYFNRFKREPGFPGVYAYDATQVVLTALGKQEKNRNLKETILSLRQFEGLQNYFSFDPYGDVTRSTSISVVQNQKFVVKE